MTETATITPWTPTATADARARRARVNRSIREFFHARGVQEVETPLLSKSANTDPNIDSMTCPVEPDGMRYLRTSPEFAMKRLLAAGSGAIYELGKVFRSGEAGRNHNPEFTMLEWYRPGFSLSQLIDELLELVLILADNEGQHLSVRRRDYRDLVVDHCGIDPMVASDDALKDLVRDRGWYEEDDIERQDCLDLILGFGVSSDFPPDGLTVIEGFPACQCALARISPEDPQRALRFEVFIGARELANGYDELFEPGELSDRFRNENQRRQQRGQPIMPVDAALLDAVQAGIDPGCGVSLGVDRLLMALGSAASIDQVISFPGVRA